jgi:hypothetical protein
MHRLTDQIGGGSGRLETETRKGVTTRRAAVSGPTDTAEPRSSRTGGRLAAVVAIVLATIGSVWLAVWPCFYTGTTSGSSGESTTCSSLIAENGTWVISYLAVPIILTILAFLGLVARLRAVMWALAILLLALCILAAWSIGLFYVPSAVALLVAAARMNPTRARPNPPLASIGDQ